tara:strand:- start:380 stop:496 length:117 start_codon:yes stop_codon:yes gene_type:complete
MTSKQIEQLIRDEYSGDRNPRPDLLADLIVHRTQEMGK